MPKFFLLLPLLWHIVAVQKMTIIIWVKVLPNPKFESSHGRVGFIIELGELNLYTKKVESVCACVH